MLNIDTRLLEQVKDANQLFLLMHISKRVNAATNQCFPSNATLQADTGWSRSKVYEVRQQLVDLGIIQITERRKENDRSQSSIITLNTEFISFFVTAKKHTENFTEEDTPPSATVDAPVRHSVPTPSATANTEHINQLNVLTIEQNNPLPPLEGGEDSFDRDYNINLSSLLKMYPEYCMAYCGLKINSNLIDKKLVDKMFRHLYDYGYDASKVLVAIKNIGRNDWERSRNYPSLRIKTLLKPDTIMRYQNLGRATGVVSNPLPF